MKSQQFKVYVNDQFEFQDLKIADLDVVPSGSNAFHILRNKCSYRAEIISADYAKKVFLLRINGSRYQVRLADVNDQLVQELGLGTASSQVVKEVVAPMPGLVLQIKVKEGDRVSKGDPLFILEAMKMENMLKAPAEGAIRKIHVRTGQPVEKNQLLIEME